MLKDTLFVTSIGGNEVKYILDTESPCHGVVYGKASLILKHTMEKDTIKVTAKKTVLSWRRDATGTVELIFGSGARYDQHTPVRLSTPSDAAELVSLIDAIYTASAQYGPLESDIEKLLESIGDKLKKDPWGSKTTEDPEVYKDWTPQDDVDEQRQEADAEEEYDEDYDDDDEEDEDYGTY